MPTASLMAAPAATRKVWVRRPGASPTLIAYGANDVVDDVRETLLRKYGNSLGRVYDAPDITLRLTARDNLGERFLGPDELVREALDRAFPGGQSMEEALLIEVPLQRDGHRDSRRDSYSGSHVSHDLRTDYFGAAVSAPLHYSHAAAANYHHAHPHSRHAQMNHLNLHLHAPAGGGSGMLPSGHPPGPPLLPGMAGSGSGSATVSPHHLPHSISVLSTGHIPSLPNLPSPGSSRRQLKDRLDRPKLNRQHSANSGADSLGHLDYLSQGPSSHSMVAVQARPGTPKISIAAPLAGKGVMDGMMSGDGFAAMGDGGPGGIVVPGSAMDAMEPDTVPGIGPNGAITSPPARNGAASPRPASPLRVKKMKKFGGRPMEDDQPEVRLGSLPMPPINVLIVEDNIINLKLLEAFVKRLKVRWQTAMNGRDAVLKWRTGGFHLVLMDIQLPLMSGLDATREIRRLERVNSIGVFASTPSDQIGNGRDPRSDKLENMSLFKSPVIIVALTASSLQSDRNDALAAGCNDFLTKPVNFVWLEKKIMEWGCMQALIDFDGWRKWKELKLPSLPAQDAADANGAAGDSKKSKRHGHAKRPSMPPASPEMDSSETIMTISPGEPVSSTARLGMAAEVGPGLGPGSAG